MKHKYCGLLKIASVLLLFFTICLTGCEKKTDETSSPPDNESSANNTAAENDVKQLDPEKAFVSAPDVSIAALKEIKADQLEMKDPPSFVRRMKRNNKESLKMGTISLGEHQYMVLLGDNTSYEFHIQDVNKDQAPYWWGSWSLHSRHLLKGKYYEFKLIENGTKIAGRPYTGEFGIFKLGKGERNIEKMEMNGSIEQTGDVGAPVGDLSKLMWPDPVAECSVPVGDYTANLMSVVYDDLKIDISHNYYTNVKGQSATKNVVYGMQVRKDKPYILDFSNEPAIIFESPKNDGDTYSLGNEIKFSAVLIDPKLDIMIRGLDDTSQKVEKEYKDNDGNVIHTAKISKSLDPKVVVTRSNGEVVGEGVMPFG